MMKATTIEKLDALRAEYRTLTAQRTKLESALPDRIYGRDGKPLTPKVSQLKQLGRRIAQIESAVHRLVLR